MDRFASDPPNPAGPGAETAAGQRHAARDSLFLAAALKIGGGDAETVRVRNLSEGGLMAEYPRGAAIGTPVQIDVRGIGWIAGKVAWSAVGRIGIAFDTPIDPKLARKPVGKGGHTPAFAKPLIRR